MKTCIDIENNRKIFEATAATYYDERLHPSRQNPSFHDLVYMVDGSWDFRVGECVYKVYPGDVFFLPAGVSYEGVSKRSVGTKTVYIHTQALESDSVAFGIDIPSDDFHVPVGILIHCGNDEAIRTLFFEMALIHCSDRPQKQMMMNAIFKSIICLLYTYENETVIKKGDVVNECIEIIRENPKIFFKETEMAEKLFISDKTLRKAFEKKCNKSFYKFQLDYKLDQASSMLMLSDDAKIYEISDSLGFNDEFHFSKLFKKKYGMPPSVYRQKLEK